MAADREETAESTRSEQAFSSAIRRFFREEALAHPVAVLLEGMPRLTQTVGARDDLNRWTLMGFGARQTAQARGHWLTIQEQAHRIEPQAVHESLFNRLRALLNNCRQFPEVARLMPDAPFSGGLMGFVGYEFGRCCDPALWNAIRAPDASGADAWPDAYWVECEDWLLLDRRKRQLFVLNDEADRATRYHARWQAVYQQAERDDSSKALGQDDFREADETFRHSFDASLSPHAFAAGVAQLQRAIAAGDIYQANLSMRFSRRLRLDPLAVYETLSRRNPSPFSGFLRWPGHLLLSNSPERLAQVSGAGRAARMRPIAGTRGRGATRQEDARIGQTLLNDEKERAEHLMLVDLARNDLGRVCQAGSVHAHELLTVERYSHVTHLVSDVSGQLAPQADAWDVLRATFPGGTITGCPKIRCVELLSQVEPVERGPYTGAMGYWDAASGRMDLNILIRTLTLRPTFDALRYNARPEAEFEAAFSVGAGIVADSVAEREYRECQRKAAALFGALFTCQRSPS